MSKRAVPYGFVVDKRDSTGMTLLMTSAQHGAYERMLQCLDEGSDINAVDDAGNNALMHALQSKQDSIAVALIRRGINAAHQKPGGTTALIEACMEQMPEVIENLLLKKVPLDPQSKLGETALMISCALGDGWAACRIAEEGADFETLKNDKGFTAHQLARMHMKTSDLLAFEKILDQRRTAKAEAEHAAEAARQHTLENNVVEATVLQRDIKPLKPVALKLKPR